MNIDETKPIARGLILTATVVIGKMEGRTVLSVQY